MSSSGILTVTTARRTVALLLLAGADIATGQGTATVRGQVRSARTGEALSGATVLVVGTRTGAVTDSSGSYSIGDLPAGRATLRARAFGFADADQTVELTAGESRVVNFQLTESITTLGAVLTKGKPADREVFESRPNVGVTLIPGKVASSVPRLGEADVLRAAQLLPGVEARNDFSAGLNVRGGEADQNLILLDGYPIFNPFHLGGLFGTFIDGAVGGLEIRTGGFPAQFGGRLSSILDVKSFEETRSGFHGSSTVSMLSTSATVSSAFGEGRGGWMISGRRTYADKVLKALGQDAIPYYFNDLQAHATYRLGANTALAVTAYTGRDDLSADLAAADSTPDGGRVTFFWGNRVTGVTLTHSFTPNVHLVHSASYSVFNTALDLGSGTLRLENKAAESSIKGSLDFRVGTKHTPMIGYELMKDDMLYKVGSDAASVTLLDDRQHPLSLGAFVDDVWKPTKRVIIQGGLRYERLQGASWQAISPRASAKFFVTPDIAVSAAMGRYSQWLHSLAREDIPIRLFDFWTASDTTIAVSRATHYVLGVESWFGADRFIRLESYVKEYDRLLEPDPADNPDVHGDEYRSLRGRSYGADLLMRQLERGKWGGWVAYTYTFSTRDGNNGTFYPGQDRRNNLNIVGTYRASSKYLWSTRFGYASGTPYTDIVGEIIRRHPDIRNISWTSGQQVLEIQAVGGPRNASRMPATQRLDVTVTRDFGGRVKLTPFLSVINAYNAKNVFMYTFDYTGRPPTRKAFSQLPLLPTVGLTLEW
jgi:hypothetical protein